MARYSYRQSIRATSLRNRADSTRFANALGNFGVRRGRSGGNLPQRLPYTLLKYSSANIEWKFEFCGGLGDKSYNRCNKLFKSLVTADKFGLWELILQTLAATGNNKTRAAELLGISLKTLHNKLKEYGGERSEGE